MTIKIDTREPKGVFERRLVEFGHTDFKRVKCEWGADFVIEQGGRARIGIQRKEISDFANSLDKLKDTMEELRANYPIGALLVEGTNQRENQLYARMGSKVLLPEGGRYKPRLELSALHNFTFSQGVRGSPVLYTLDHDETARLLANLHGYTGPDMASEGVGSQVAMMQQLPGIGEAMAQVILSHYEGDIVAALGDIEGWGEVDGVGEKTIRVVKEFLE